MKTCLRCSKEFTPTHNNQKCCSSECRKSWNLFRNMMNARRRVMKMTFADKVELSRKVAIKRNLWTEEKKEAHRKYYRELMRKRRNDTTR